MKKFLLLLFFMTLLVCSFAQVTQINADKNLLPVAILNNTLALFESDIDSSLWVSDGTLAGTFSITDTIKYIGAGALMNGKYFFKGISPNCGSEIFISDGTKSGTHLVKDINPGKLNSQPTGTPMAVLNGFVYFAAVTEAEGCELWRTDGTESNTLLVKDIVSGTGSGIDSTEFTIHALNNKLIFTALIPPSGNELWSTDGSTGNTVMIHYFGGASNPRGFYYFDSMYLFTINASDIYYNQLWTTDGTSTGTILLKDTISSKYPYTGDTTSSTVLHIFNDRIYFLEENINSANASLWTTDGISGTTNHTSFVKDIETNYSDITPDSGMANAINLPAKFIFPYTDNLGIRELWVSDGSAIGTNILESAPIAQGPGTTAPVIYSNINYDPATQAITYPLYNGNFYFSLYDVNSTGKELWISDGTSGNTKILDDINPGTADGIVYDSWLYTDIGLFFAANDGSDGNELWKTDGVTTSMVQDIFPGSQSSNPVLLFINNNKVFFTADDGVGAGRDLYVLDGNFSVLPVELLDFTVTPRSPDALLQWSTSSEINSKDFIIQSSDDAIHWNIIGTVPAAGNSSLQKNYSFTDVGIMNSGKSIVYYRLLQTDIDGNSTNSNIVELTINNNNQWNVQLYSNPVQGQLRLMLTGIRGKTSLLINDMSGRIIYNSQLQNQNGLVTIPVSLPPGVYVLKVMANNETKAIKFVKE